MRGVKAWILMAAVVGFAATASAESKKKKPAPPPEPAAEQPAPPQEEAPPDPLEGLPHIKGPQLVSLHPEIEIDLPAGAILLEQKEAVELVKEGGGDTEGVIGALLNPDKNWLVLIEYAPIGHVTDSDADELDAAQLLE